MSDCYFILNCSLGEKTGGKASGDGHNLNMIMLLWVLWLVSARSPYVPRQSEYRAVPLIEHNYLFASLHSVYLVNIYRLTTEFVQAV